MTQADLTNDIATKDAAPPPAATLLTTLAPVTALLLSVALLLMGNGLQGTLLPVRGNVEGFSTFDIGLLGSSYYSGFILGCLFGPLLIRRAGHIRAFMAMASVASVVALIHAVVFAPWLWWVLRAMGGLCFAVLYIVIESWLNEKSTNETRGTVFSVYIMVNLTVITIGQLMMGLASPESFALFALSSILVSLAVLPVAFTTAASPAPVPFIRPSFAKLRHLSPVGFYGCLAVGLANGAFWGLGPVFAQERGFDPSGVGVFMSAVVLGGAAMQWPLGRLSDRLDRRILMLVAGVLAMVPAAAIVLLADLPYAALFALAALFGGGAFPLYALAVAHANDHATPEAIVEVSSGLLLVHSVGAALGPILAAFLQIAGLGMGTALFTFTLAVHAVFVVFVLLRMTQSRPVVPQDRVTYAEAALAAQTLTPYDPIAEEIVTGEIATDDDPAAGDGPVGGLAAQSGDPATGE